MRCATSVKVGTKQHANARRLFLNKGGRMFVLSFEGEKGRERFEICYIAVTLTQRQVAVSEWDDVVGLLKALKSCGVMTKDKIAGTDVDLCDLVEGRQCTLQRSEQKVLLDFISQPIWRPAKIEAVQECKAWIAGIPASLSAQS